MRKLLFIAVLLAGFFVHAAVPRIIFKDNKGQWPENVLFGTEFYNVKFYVNKTSFNYCIYNPDELALKGIKRINENQTVHGHNYEVNFAGADFNNPIKTDKQPEYYNYFLGNDKSKWAARVQAFGNLQFKNIYGNIDLILYSDNLDLKYDLIVKKGGDVNSIRLNYNYTDGIKLENNEIVIQTSVGEIREKEPVAWQYVNGKKENIKCKYTLLEDNTIGFTFPDGYNLNYELVIDPVVVACSYSGASVFTYNYACTYDASGNIYNAAGGEMGYPTTMGAFQLTGHVTDDCIISVFNSTGTSKLFATYLGGASYEYPIDIHVSKNSISILGVTSSTNYPCSQNGFDTILSGTQDLFVTKLDTSGSNLISSTLIGGSSGESLIQFSNSGYPSINGEMAVDNNGNIYVISNTTSLDFPCTPGAIFNFRQGSSDAIVFKLNPSLSNLVWSTYLGGLSNEEGSSIKLDGSGGVYCSGTTNSTNFPTTPGTIRPVKTGGVALSDQFVCHIDPTGTTLIASTYLGTESNDVATLMDVDFNNSVYLCGYVANSNSLTPTPGTYANINSLNTIYKINSSLTAINYQSKFGPSGSTQQQRLLYTAFAVDSCGNLYLGGVAYTGFPTTPDQFQPFGGGFTDMYIAVFNTGFSSLRFASYYGGNAPPPNGYSIIGEQSYGISHFDDRGILYLAVSASENLPTLPGAYAPNYANTTSLARIYNDAFLKIDLKTFINAHSSYGANIIGCPPFNSHFVSTTNTGTSYWDLGDGTTTNQDTISHIYNNTGTYNVLLVVTDTTTCNRTDSIKSLLNVVDPIAFNPDETSFLCFNTNVLLQSHVSALTYSWSTGETTPDIYVNNPGAYTVTVFNGGCYSSNVMDVMYGEDKLSERFPNVITPNSDNVNDRIDFEKYNLGEMEFALYDRWGTLQYKSSDLKEPFIPNGLQDGTYFYIINFLSNCTGKHSMAKGFISIFK